MNDATKHEDQSKKSPSTEQNLRPAMDIFEDDTGITVQADMPGVPKDRLEIQIDSDTLSIGGDIVLEMPNGMEAVFADVRLTRYYRSFTLSRELDGDKVEATFKDGVLTLRIPKREVHQTRRIEVKTL